MHNYKVPQVQIYKVLRLGKLVLYSLKVVKLLLKDFFFFIKTICESLFFKKYHCICLKYVADNVQKLITINNNDEYIKFLFYYLQKYLNYGGEQVNGRSKRKF